MSTFEVTGFRLGHFESSFGDEYGRLSDLKFVYELSVKKWVIIIIL